MKKHLACAVVALTFSLSAKHSEYMYVDVFKTMRECDQGKQVAAELDALRERLSKEIEVEAKKLADRERELKTKATTMRREALEKEERALAKERRALEDRVRDGEEELKMSMNQKTEMLAIEVEKNIAAVAKAKDIDRVIDVSGRTVYCKDGTADDITGDAISFMNAQNKETSKAAVTA